MSDQIGPDGLTDRQRAALGATRNNLGVSNAPPPPAPQPAPILVQQPQPTPERERGILGILKGRQQQIDKAAGYARGGKIKACAQGGLIRGPGTPTSDSIAGQVRESGEPILVSNGERIVSAEQDKLLGRIAQMLGFESVDALLESGTGKPVGPTIKGGKLAAAGGASIGWNNNVEDEYTRAMKANSLPSMGTNNAAAQGGIYKDVGLPAISMGAGQAPTIYDNGGLDAGTVQRGIDTMRSQLADGKPKLSAPVVEAGKQAIAGQVAPQPAPGPKQWYSGTDSSDPRTGLEMERDRRAQATSAGVMNDPVKSALQYGVVGSAHPQGIAGIASPSTAASAPQATASSNYGNEGRSVPTPITKTNPGAVVDNEFKVGGKSYNVNDTSQQGITRVTAPGTSPLYTNIDPQQAANELAGMKSGQMRIGDGGFNLAEQNERMAKSLGYGSTADFNKMWKDRSETVRGGIGIMADPADEANANLNAMRQSSIVSGLSPSQQAAFQQAQAQMAMQGRGQQLVADSSRYSSDVQAQRAAGHDQVLMRGQDLNAQNELARLQGNPLDNQTKQLSLTQAQQIGKLQDAVLNGKTPEEQAAAAAKIRALSGKQDREDRTVKPMEIADPNDPTGQRKILVRPNDDGTYTPMQPRRTYAEFAQAYLSKKPGTSPEQMKADYEQLYGGR